MNEGCWCHARVTVRGAGAEEVELGRRLRMLLPLVPHAVAGAWPGRTLAVVWSVLDPLGRLELVLEDVVDPDRDRLDLAADAGEDWWVVGEEVSEAERWEPTW